MKALAPLFLFFSFVVSASETAGPAKVTRVVSYSEYGNGDVMFSLQSNGEICNSGYYISKSDPGFEANLSMLLAAYHAKTEVRVYANEDKKWKGSQNYYCHVYAISYGQ